MTDTIPTLPKSYSTDKVVFFQYSGDKFTAKGVYADAAKTKLSDLDLNKEVNTLYTWDSISGSDVVSYKENRFPEDLLSKENMIQSTKNLYCLNVPYVSQLGTNADEHNNDCGAASGVMVIKAYTGENVSVDQFYNETGISYDGYLSATQIIKVLSQHKVGSQWRISNMQELMTNLRSGKPIICLVSYKTIRDSISTESSFGGFHFLLAIGYDTKNIYVHDPLWKEQGGKEFSIPYDIFEKAWKDAGKDPTQNPSFGCVIPTYSIGEATPTQYPKYKVTASVLNIRSTPDSSNSSNIIGKLYKNDIVTISEIQTDKWGKLYGRTGWIHTDYVVKV